MIVINFLNIFLKTGMRRWDIWVIFFSSLLMAQFFNTTDVSLRDLSPHGLGRIYNKEALHTFSDGIIPTKQ